MKIRRFAFRGTAVAAAVLSLTALSAGSASADYTQCEPGWFCMWEHMNYKGRFFALRNGEESPNFGKEFNDKMTSYWNRSNHTYLVFRDANYGACIFTIRPGASEGAVQEWRNDEATSARKQVESDIYNLFCQG